MIDAIAPPTLEEIDKLIANIEDIKAVWNGHRESGRLLDVDLYCLRAVRDSVQSPVTLPKNTVDSVLAHDLADRLERYYASLSDYDPAYGLLIDFAKALRGGAKSFANQRDVDFENKLNDPVYAKQAAKSWRRRAMELKLSVPAPPTHNSPPDSGASHNHGEGDPAVMPNYSGVSRFPLRRAAPHE